MSEKNTGGLAFPVTEQNGVNYPDGGMTLRDYFAAKALQSLISEVKTVDVMDVEKHGGVHEFCADAAYLYADAMLKAREE